MLFIWRKSVMVTFPSPLTSAAWAFAPERDCCSRSTDFTISISVTENPPSLLQSP